MQFARKSKKLDREIEQLEHGQNLDHDDMTLLLRILPFRSLRKGDVELLR